MCSSMLWYSSYMDKMETRKNASATLVYEVHIV